MTLCFSCPYSTTIDQSKSVPAHPGYNAHEAHEFIKRHGFGARAIGILVDDAAAAHEASVAHGGISACAPRELRDAAGSAAVGYCKLAEIKLYGDAVLRFVSKHDGYNGAFLPNYAAINSPPVSYAIGRINIRVIHSVPLLNFSALRPCFF